MSSCRSCSAEAETTPAAGQRYRRILWIALYVNVGMFAVEMIASLVAGSVSVQADALDFLGDVANYAVALIVAGAALQWRARAALLKGAVMGLFGLWVAGTTVSHALAGTLPEPGIMGAIGLAALTANLAVACSALSAPTDG